MNKESLQEARQNWFINTVTNMILDNPGKEISDKTGYSVSTISTYLNRKRKISVDFMQTFCKAFKYDFDRINHELIDSIKNDILDTNPVKNTLTMERHNSVPSKSLSLLDKDLKINSATFASLLPSDIEKNNWIPAYNKIESLVDQLNTTPNNTPNNWPMYSDNLIRAGNDYGDYQTFAPPYDNMSPRIYPNDPIFIIQVTKQDILSGVPYLLIFGRGHRRIKAMIYFISHSETQPGMWELISHNPLYGKVVIDPATVKEVFEVNIRF